MDPNSKEKMDATYIGMVFLDIVFVGGKGVIMFAVFGLEYETVIKPIFKWETLLIKLCMWAAPKAYCGLRPKS